MVLKPQMTKTSNHPPPFEHIAPLAYALWACHSSVRSTTRKCQTYKFYWVGRPKKYRSNSSPLIVATAWFGGINDWEYCIVYIIRRSLEVHLVISCSIWHHEYALITSWRVICLWSTYTPIDNSTDYGHMMIDDVRIVYYQRAKILSINLSSWSAQIDQNTLKKSIVRP